METEIHQELFKHIGSTFHNFFSKEENDKIIFSGKYGSGKTTFLKTYFDHPENLELKKHDCELFRISPVNYSVADTNNDIIELIKYDVITQFLLKPNLEVKTDDIPSYYFISEKDIETIFKNLVSLINVKGISLSAVIEGLRKLKQSLDEKKAPFNEGDLFINFLDNLQKTTGIFERDIITKTIENVLSRLVTAGKIPVLLIDDFDRLDPEHTFRILNIFSAHFDNELYNKQGLINKFGFKKIIIVCDYNNVQSLYQHRYGAAADFSGYIDKFYSSVVFDFDIKKEVSQFLKNILLQTDAETLNKYRDEFNYFGIRSEELFQQSIIYGVLGGLLSLRAVLKIKNINIDNHFPRLDEVIYSSRRRTSNYSLYLLKLNIYLFGGSEGYFQVLEKLNAKGFTISVDSYTLDLIIAIEKKLKNLSLESVTIETEKHQYQFRIDDHSRVSTVGIIINNKPDSLNNAYSLDLMKHFIHRLSQSDSVD